LWRHYLEGNPHRLEAVVYTDHWNLERFMTTKQLTRQQARWAETMGCFDFKIVFQPGRQSSKPDALLCQPDLAPTQEDKLSFGQLLQPKNITAQTFAEVSDFKAWFDSEEVHLPDADHWFEIDVLGAQVTQETPSATAIKANTAIIANIRAATHLDDQLLERQRRGDSGLSTKDGLVYNSRGLIEVPADDAIKTNILRSRHDSKLEGHPGRARTLALIKRCFTWPSLKRFVNRYVDGCESCQQVKPSTRPPFGSLEPLAIPARPWTDISYDLITNLPKSHVHDSILTVVDRLTKMAHFVPCSKSLNAGQLADLILHNVWKLHGTPKFIVSDRGSLFILQITREMDRQLGIQLHPSTAYHPRTDGQSEIANKAVEQYLHHFTRYHQDDWHQLLPTAEFAYNNSTYTSTGISPFKANYGVVFHSCSYAKEVHFIYYKFSYRIQEEEYQGGVQDESGRIHNTPTSQNQQQGRVTPTASRRYGQW
jgi:hypothetical protein